ncbi:MAG: hypothetical protein NDJ92_07350 [Thermoanaerobaculia bacterium]|nr:hypothetical protein [Thermoanaerobaculia bacterium]
MSTMTFRAPAFVEEGSGQRANDLADRLQLGARSLAELAGGLTMEQWNTRLPHDGRRIGVVVHHVASVYPVEVQLAMLIAEGKPVAGVTMEGIHRMNAEHASMYDAVTKEATLELLRTNSSAAAAAIRAMSDEELDRAATVSLYANATLTSQFVLEDHAVRHSYHHLAGIRRALNI